VLSVTHRAVEGYTNTSPIGPAKLSDSSAATSAVSVFSEDRLENCRLAKARDEHRVGCCRKQKPKDRVTLLSAMTHDPALDAEVRSFVDDYRERCLWFIRADYYPSTPDEILRVLRWIRARGDRKAFQRAGKIEEWLSRTFNEKSAAS
jgi:hypothetical protein